MPMTIRPPEMSWSVAYALASTVGSRVPGFVTQWPNFIDVVACSAMVRSGNDSCQSTCESYVQPYWKPFASAWRISSRKRLYGGSGRTVTPKLNAISGSPSLAEGAIIALEPSDAQGDQGGGGEGGDCREGELSVSPALEGETGKGGPEKDRDERARVDRRDGRCGRVGTC